MNQTIQTSDEAHEARLMIFHKRLLESLIRKEAVEEKVSDALKLAQDERLPRQTIELGMNCYGLPNYWQTTKGLGAAFENYVTSLHDMCAVRRNTRGTCLSTPYREAFAAVLNAADFLEQLGWPVNWRQNVQVILETTEFGLSDRSLVDRYADIPTATTLGERLKRLGELTFYKQRRRDDGSLANFSPTILSGVNKNHYENTPLVWPVEADRVHRRFSYVSAWLDSKSGSFRILV